MLLGWVLLRWKWPGLPHGNGTLMGSQQISAMGVPVSQINRQFLVLFFYSFIKKK